MSKTYIRIGRDPRCDLHIDERWDTVSNQHAEIEQNGNQLFFTDHSTNGTVINGQKVHNMTVGIYQGDVIKLANVFLLEWDVINTFFPYNNNRPTVTHNTHGYASDTNGGRKTVQMHDAPREQDHGRKTEAFKPEQQRQQPQYPPQYQQRTGGNQANEPTAKTDSGKENVYSQSQIDKELGRWNWGAFFCTWLWSVCNGLYWPAFVILVALIPYIGQVCALALSVYLGLKGTRMAWNKCKDKDFDKFKRRQRNWAIAGLIAFILTVIYNIYMLKYVLNIF